MVVFNEDRQNKQLKELKDLDEENLAQRLSLKYTLPYTDLSVTPVNAESLRMIDEATARAGLIAPFSVNGHKLEVAVVAPQNTKTIEVIGELKQKGYEVNLHIASINSLEVAWAQYKDLSFSFETKAGALDISNEEISEILKNVKSVPDVKKLIEETLALKKSHRITKIFEIILSGAIATGSSDIHIEPEESYVRLRYRLDGVLVDIVQFDIATYSLILSRIKLLSGLKLNVRGSAQDGRFSIKIEDADIEIRTSVLPGAYNDSVVMRVLNPKSISVPLEELGISDSLFAIIQKQLNKPNGMILTTGPTGSGKTTTLYAFLKKIHTSDIKIITIENPIEYHLPGIVQTQTDTQKGYTFLSGLRAALRQDPDVIMVGEIRDNETAEIAVNASLTGHLVFSTLHTNNAAGTYPRLIDLGVNPKILTSALSMAMAQRLVRKLCQNCRKETKVNDTDKKTIDKIIATIPEGPDKQKISSSWSVYEPIGCPQCNMTGYKGRIGVYEAILTDEEIEKVIITNPSERDIRKAADRQGLYTLQQDGIVKVINGQTSLDELERVVDLDAV